MSLRDEDRDRNSSTVIIPQEGASERDGITICGGILNEYCMSPVSSSQMDSLQVMR